MTAPGIDLVQVITEDLRGLPVSVKSVFGGVGIEIPWKYVTHFFVEDVNGRRTIGVRVKTESNDVVQITIDSEDGLTALPINANASFKGVDRDGRVKFRSYSVDYKGWSLMVILS
mgnify:CR=1 FL=1